MDRNLRTRVLEVVRNGRRSGEYFSNVDPLTMEGYTEREVIDAVDSLKEEGLLADRAPSMQWWKEDRLSGPGSHVLNEIEEERDSKLYWNMLMEDHRRAAEAKS